MKKEILRMENVTRQIEGITYLNNINFHIFKDEIMGLLTINSQGEHQLVSLISQNLPIQYGRIYFDDLLVNSYAHSDMTRNRVSLIGAGSRLVNNLTISDNIFVLRRGFKKWFIKRSVLNLQVQKLLEEINIEMKPGRQVKGLSSLERCTVELLRAVTAGSELIILNNLSSFFSTVELRKFLDIVQFFRKEGIAFLYISCDYKELIQACHRIAILDSGKIIKILPKKEMSAGHISPYIISFDSLTMMESPEAGSSIFQFENVSTDYIENLSFSINKGECTVILDMNNSGLQEIIALILGEKSPLQGAVLCEGGKESAQNIGIISADPIPGQIFENFSYAENICFFTDVKIKKSISRKKLLKSVINEYEPFIGPEIHTKNISELELSSLYNIVYFRYHLYHPKILFCIQPLAQADMYLRRHILGLIQKLKNKGITIVILTVSISELMDVADRVLIMKDAKMIKDCRSDEFLLFQSHSGEQNSI